MPTLARSSQNPASAPELPTTKYGSSWRKVNQFFIESGQALFTPLKLRSEGLVPASAAQSADADFRYHLPRRRDSQPSFPLRFPEVRETLQGPRTPTPLATAQKIPARPAMASSGSCAASG